MSFDFEIPPGISFRPKVIIQNVSPRDIERVGESAFSNFVFHLGLAEMPSYWKVTASPRIVIEAGFLVKSQIAWWRDLFMKGMGQYFFENNLDFTKPNFLEIKPSFSKGYSRMKTMVFPKQMNKRKTGSRILLPIGGGKDAIVTYEILSSANHHLVPFVLNPRKEQLAILRTMGERNPVAVQRAIDPALLALNRKGYLNGHTPFSAYLAFLTTLCAALFGCKYIALSNERSSNEGNVKYLGHTINHQYSKSFEFEKRFRLYNKTYLATDIEYFSFLRPLYDLQIAKVFAGHQKYFATFLSCNEAHKTKSRTKKPTGKWCGKCAKCLFVFACLYPFVETKKLENKFGWNLFEDASLIPLMEELVGEGHFKPFECVGTAKESLCAFYLSLQKTHPPLPPLLKHFRAHIAKKHPNLHQTAKSLLSSWNQNHFLLPKFERRLKAVLS